MKILKQEAFGEVRQVFVGDNGPEEIRIWRDLVLNVGEVIEAQITVFNPTLHGYFAKTIKGDLFLPTERKFTEGEKVWTQVVKEARDEKVATAHLSSKKENKLQFEGDEISSSEMDEIIDQSLETEVLLKNGAKLHIEKTKVCWTIDVDSGKSQDSLIEVNQKALMEIERQIKLKNMGGLILIDFSGSKRGAFKNQIEKGLQFDSLSKVMGWTKSGLLEVERRRERSDLLTNCSTQNPVHIYYVIRRALAASKISKPVLYVAPCVLNLLKKLNLRIKICPIFDKPISYFEIKES